MGENYGGKLWEKIMGEIMGENYGEKIGRLIKILPSWKPKIFD